MLFIALAELLSLSEDPKVKAQADKLVSQRYMLPADAARIVAEAEAAKWQ